GHFVFSTHNPRAVMRLPDDRSPRSLAIASVMTARRTWHMTRSSAFWRGEGYVPDLAQEGLRVHVATPAFVGAELRGAGFALLDAASWPPSRGRFAANWWYFV